VEERLPDGWNLSTNSTDLPLGQHPRDSAASLHIYRTVCDVLTSVSIAESALALWEKRPAMRQRFEVSTQFNDTFCVLHPRESESKSHCLHWRRSSFLRSEKRPSWYKPSTKPPTKSIRRRQSINRRNASSSIALPLRECFGSRGVRYVTDVSVRTDDFGLKSGVSPPSETAHSCAVFCLPSVCDFVLAVRSLLCLSSF
jgi:hypothetical protein